MTITGDMSSEIMREDRRFAFAFLWPHMGASFVTCSHSIYCFLVNGTTGETVSFTPEERKKSAEAWVKEGKNKSVNK